MKTTDPRLAPLAAALYAADAKLRRPADGTTRLRHRVGQYWFRDYAAAILAALPPDWCGHRQPPEGTRLILAATDLISYFGTRTGEGRTLTAEWGEPDANGWYTPTFTASGPAVINEQAATIATLRAALEDAGYLADSAKHLTDHLTASHPEWYCEDMDNTQHFAAKVRHALDTHG
jgi:hypothetical protein